MGLFGQGVLEAFRLLLAGDPEVWQITWLSLQVSAGATALSLLVGIPLGALLALASFPGRALAVSLVNTGMGLPPVVVGLFVTILLWRNGALGFLELLYTPSAMVAGQFVIAAPIVTGLTLAAVQQVPEAFRLQMLALGASHAQMRWVLLKEARLPMRRDLRGGRLHDAGRQYPRLHARAHHRHRARDRQGQLRPRDCHVGDPLADHLPGELGAELHPAAPARLTGPAAVR
jgi:tungstate transport system permease protein